MRSRWPRIAAMLLVLGARPASAADCTFADLQWSADGATLHFSAGDSVEVQPLQVDIASGVVTHRAPRVADPCWNPRTQRVLFRDDFGIYEFALHGAAPRPLVSLPVVSTTFLRALGCDAQGALLLWTIARDSGEHEFWRRGEAGLDKQAGAATGAEALRDWEARNRAQPFQALGGQFVHSVCLQRAGTDARLCFERLVPQRPALAPVFRLVLAAQGRASVVLDRCVPGALGVSADSSQAVLGVFEEPDAAGNSEVLSLWLSDFEKATRVAETVLPQPAPTARRQYAWAHWLGARELLWVDNAGQLYRVQVTPPQASALVLRPPTRALPPAPRARPRAGDEGPHVAGPDGSVAFVRHQGTAAGLRSEIWILAPGAAARLLVPVWDRVAPAYVP